LKKEKKKKMKKTNLLAILTLAATPAFLHAQTTSYSGIVGYVNGTYNPSSDSIVAPQLERPSELVASVSGVSGATFQLSGVSLTPDQFKYVTGTQAKTYYALVTAGSLAGTYFTIESNTSSELVVQTDGLAPSSADVTAIEVRPYWTIGSLFPASDAGVSFVASTSTTTAGRRTQILIPDNINVGVNRSPSKILFFNPTLQDWVASTATNVRAGDTSIVPPNTYVILRNTGGTPPTLNHTVTGSVNTKSAAVYLATRNTGANDNYCTISRPADTKLSEMGFIDSSFVQSTSKTTAGRRDTLLVIDKTGSGINRSPSKVYFKFGGAWYDTSATATAVDPLIPAGSAMVIRKYQSDGFDKVLVNNPNYSSN
jgi:uncharacterized protein (TIGR02597 family)